MGTKHKHYDAIVAWANGEKCEFFSRISEKWEPLNPNSVPAFYEDYEYRIKPKRVKKEGWVNVFKYPKSSADRAAIVSNAYPTEEAANAELNLINRVACIRIEWEEEE